jgi:asparaginyl-tRNA synthetase
VSDARNLSAVRIEDIGRHVGEEVEIKGWVHQRRGSGKVAFLVVRDGSGIIQAVGVKAELSEGSSPA